VDELHALEYVLSLEVGDVAGAAGPHEPLLDELLSFRVGLLLAHNVDLPVLLEGGQHGADLEVPQVGGDHHEAVTGLEQGQPAGEVDVDLEGAVGARPRSAGQGPARSTGCGDPGWRRNPQGENGLGLRLMARRT
jgi:hypothetical protein